MMPSSVMPFLSNFQTDKPCSGRTETQHIVMFFFGVRRRLGVPAEALRVMQKFKRLYVYGGHGRVSGTFATSAPMQSPTATDGNEKPGGITISNPSGLDRAPHVIHHNPNLFNWGGKREPESLACLAHKSSHSHHIAHIRRDLDTRSSRSCKES
jgi:hypothetical protein